VKPRKDREGGPWVFRHWSDLQPDGTLRPIWKYQALGPSKGEGALSKRQGEVARDKFLLTINKPTIEDKIADGLVLVSKMVERYRAAHVDAQVAGRFLLAKPTRLKYAIHLEQRILPIGGGRRLNEIRPDEFQQWLFETCDSCHMMNDVRGIVSAIYTKAEGGATGRKDAVTRCPV
jgi:hypothetical protein